MWRFLKRTLTRDIPLKLSSLGLAILIMLLILAVRMEPRTFQGVPVRIVDIPGNMVLRGDCKPSRVDVDMRGPRDILDEVKGKIAVEVSMAEAGAGNHSVRLAPGNVKIDIPVSHRKRVQVDSGISDWQVTCDLEMYTAEVSVAMPDLEGVPQPPYYCDPSMLEVKPKKIRVTAAPESLEEIRRENRPLPLESGVVNVDGANQEVYHRRYRVNFEALGVQPVFPEDRWVEVTIRLERGDFEKELTVGNVRVRNVPEGAQASFRTKQDEKITAMVEGRASVLEALQPSHLTAWLDASLVVGATDYVPVRYEVVASPEMRVRVKRWRPDTIQLKVSRGEEGKERTGPAPGGE